MRLRRPTSLVLTALLPAGLALAACGGSDDGELLKGFDAVSVSGKPGEAPEVEWKGTMSVGGPESKVLVKGDGKELAKGDRVLVNLVLANGYTHKTTLDSYGDAYAAAVMEVGSSADPQSAGDLLLSDVQKAIKPGMRLGDRIGVAVNSEKLLGNYLGDASVSQLGVSLDIGNEDPLLFVAELESVALPKVDGAAAKPAGWAPKVETKNGVPTALDFSNAASPTGEVRTTTLIKGTGAPVEKGELVVVKYLGQTNTAAKPFDQNFSGDETLPAVIGDKTLPSGQGTPVIKGWTTGLVGTPVGSRVLIQIPPKQGYGKDAQKDSKGKVTIPANSTLYFVIDVLAAG